MMSGLLFGDELWYAPIAGMVVTLNPLLEPVVHEPSVNVILQSV